MPGDSDKLAFMLAFCEFIRFLRVPGNFNYNLWLALASELHRYGDAGLQAFHELSAIDSRYDIANTERKWQQTVDMVPIRCDTLAIYGFRCPHLYQERCNGARSPAMLPEFAYHEAI
jgi:hypothetical protein